MAAIETQTSTERQIAEKQDEILPPARPIESSVKNRIRPLKIIGEVLFWLALAAGFVFELFPLFWMLVTSIKPRNEVTLLPPRFLPGIDFQPVLDNYQAVFTRASELGTISASQTSRA